MAQQTAIDWIINELRQLAHNPSTHLGMGDVRVTQGMIDDLEEQAKQIEKEQIIESNLVGQEIAAIYATTGKSPQTAEQYYNKTYGK